MTGTIQALMRTIFAALASAIAGVGALHADNAVHPPLPRDKPADLAQSSVPSIAGNLVTIVARRDWRAKPALFAMPAHKPGRIMLHHTAGPVKPARDIRDKMRALQAYSQKPAELGNGRRRDAWADVPYHFYIAANGAIAEGRDIKFSGDTNTNYEPAGHVQIVLEGNFENVSPAAQQISALEDLLVMIAKKWQVPASQIRAHQQAAATLCPGKHFMSQFEQLRERVAGQLK